MKGWSIMNFSFVYVLSFLILIINLKYYALAAKFIRNAQTLTCLDITPTTSPTSCTPVTLNACPVDRYSKFSDSLKWNLIPLNSSSLLTNNSVIMIGSNNNQLCLSASSDNVEACPCDNEIAQRWILSDDKILSGNSKGCLGLVGTTINVGKCQVGVGSGTTSWKTYHVAPNAVNLYLKPGFADDPQQLFENDYNSQSLPADIFSSPFSLEVPPGFEFIINYGNNNVIKFDSDISQMSPINSLTSIISVKLKPGMILYEYPAYFSASKFVEVGVQIPSNSIIGSVLVPKGSRGVVWSNSNFTGDNIGLFEPIVNLAATKQNFASLDVSSTNCKNECGSGGFCSENGVCTCKPGFTGERCEQCVSGFFGPNCQKCQCTVPNKNICDDGITGTGECKCKVGFINDDTCSVCAVGFTRIGNDCKECNCGFGKCDENGACECNGGFVLDDATKQCINCKDRYFKSGNDCRSCPPGCISCDQNTCYKCQQGLELNNGACSLPQNQQLPGPCDGSCGTICVVPGPQGCFSCPPPSLYLEGSCVLSDITSKCILSTITTAANQSFVADNVKQICEPCPSTCLDCNLNNLSTTNLQCTKCISGYFLSNGDCIKDCPEGQYADPASGSCLACDPSCASCEGSPKKCTKCPNNLFNLNGVCTSASCPSGFVALNATCTKCYADCLECSGPGINQCTKCPPNRPILTKDGQCVEVCPMGTYADKDGKCQKCDKTCSSCIGPGDNQCLGCADQNKVLLKGTCNGSCPAGSELNKIEKLCQNLNSEEILPPGEESNQESKTSSIRLQWWQILIIAAGSLLFLILIALLIRCIAVKRRKQKTKEFGDQIDDNAVAQNLKNMLRNARGMPSQPEMSHSRRSSLKPQKVDDLNVDDSLPAYDHKEGELYWKRKQQRHQKHISITTDDYNKWKQNLKNKDWEGFDIVNEESSSSSNNDNVEYSGYDQGEKNSYEIPSGSRSENLYRNSKGSLRSNRSINVKRTYENWI